MAIKVAGSADVSVSDGVLVGRVLEGKKAAFRELYDRRAPLIRAVCYGETRDFDAAQDLADLKSICLGFLGRAHVWFRDNLEQRDAGTIVIHK